MSFAKKHRPAEELLRNYGIDSPGDIDLEAIAHCENLKVRYKKLEGCEAKLTGYKDKGIVTITTETLETRQRFSLGHELGHWHHHRGRSFECRVNEDDAPKTQKSYEEIVADEYSADLLMPTYMFTPLASKYARPSFDNIEELADTFETSISSTAFRFIEANVSPSILICHAPTGRQWFKLSKDIPRRWFPKNELDAYSFAMDALYKGCIQRKPSKIGAESWFDRFDADRYDIFEHSKKFGDVVYTLLTIEDDEMLYDN